MNSENSRSLPKCDSLAQSEGAAPDETEIIDDSLLRSQDSGFTFSSNSLQLSQYSFAESTAERTLRLRNSCLETHGISIADANRNSTSNSSTPVEVELVSLLNLPERLPLYKLRVDPCTAFQGYKHKDFRAAKNLIQKLAKSTKPACINQSSLIKVDEEISVDKQSQSATDDDDEDEEDAQSVLSDCSLSDPEIEHCLGYLLLGGLRVSQMSQTYEDIAAVTHLLEERQNDLEMAAKIGRKLLDDKRELEQRLVDIENQLRTSNDTVEQLRFQITLKDSMLQDMEFNQPHPSNMTFDDDDTASISSTGFNSYQSDSGAFSGNSQMKLQRKIQDLLDENTDLRKNFERLSIDHDRLDEHETMLVRDCTGRLASAESTSRRLQEDLQRKSDEYLGLHFKYTQALNRLCELENNLKQSHTENDLLRSQLHDYHTRSSLLVNQCTDYRDKYDECLTILVETQKELRLRKRELRRSMRTAVTQPMVGFLPRGHLPEQMNEEYDTDEQCGEEDFAAFSRHLSSSASSNSLARELQQTALRDSSQHNFERISRAMDHSRVAHATQRRAQATDSDTTTTTERTKRPHQGTRRQSVLNDYKKMAATLGLQFSSDSSENDDDDGEFPSMVANRSRRLSLTDDSNESGRTSKQSVASISLDDLHAEQLYESSYKKGHQKLQLVKPLDGSQMLERWQKLATPTSLDEVLLNKPVDRMAARGINQLIGLSGKKQSTVNRPVLEDLRGSSTTLAAHSRKSSREEASGGTLSVLGIADRVACSPISARKFSDSNPPKKLSLGKHIFTRGLTATLSNIFTGGVEQEQTPTRRRTSRPATSSRPTSGVFKDSESAGHQPFSLGALMMSVLPENFWPLAPEDDFADYYGQEDSSTSSNSSPPSSNERGAAVLSTSSRGLLEASSLLTATPQSHRLVNEIKVERLKAQEESGGDNISIVSSSSGSTSSGQLEPGVPLISQLLTAPPLAKMRSPRAIYRPAEGMLRTLKEEEDSPQSRSASICSSKSINSS